MSESSAAPSPPLRTLVVAMSVPEGILARFRAEFPEIQFIVPSDRPTEDDVRDADAIVGWELPSHLLQAANRLRWMHASGAGVRDARQRSAATRRQVGSCRVRPHVWDRGFACGAGGSGPCGGHPPEHV